jgi:hypothetical protein
MASMYTAMEINMKVTTGKRHGKGHYMYINGGTYDV